MFIAFEGPDNTGKSTSALALDMAGQPSYNMTKDGHARDVSDWEEGGSQETVITYDRVDWFSHMVYRLALPGHEWNDDRPRTVFAMPDTHLVVKLHHPQLAELIADELYTTGTLAKVNPMYYYFADFFTGLNEEREFSLFRTISIIEVMNDPRDDHFQQRLIAWSSLGLNHEEAMSRNVANDSDLLQLLQDDERARV